MFDRWFTTLLSYAVFLGIFLPGTLILGQSAPVSGSFLMGVVTNATTGAPVIGAKISVNGQVAWSTSGGIYSLNVDPPGTYTVTCFKAGYDIFLSSALLFQPGATVTCNVQLLENAAPPGPATATLDTVPPHVHIAWGIPAGDYELLYDDGLQDNFTLWATAGNMNAVKMTPAGYPVIVTGGSVNIGNAANYPPGSNPLVPFQVLVFDAGGPGGTPGNIIGGPFDVMPTAFGWVEFTFSSPVTVSNGNFFLAMSQGGNAPNAAGLAIDETNSQLRSFSKFTGAGGLWIPGSGNYMIRTKVSGSGGPMINNDNPLPILGYQVWRLHQGEEQNPMAWVSVGMPVTNSLSDYSWPSLPCSPYRWGIKTQYSGNRWSPVAFSNILGKCWVAPVTINITLSCEAALRNGIRVQLVNQVYPDTVYTCAPDTSGTCIFPQVWKGSYILRVSKFGYITAVQSLPVNNSTATSVFLLQEKTPPSNLAVNDRTLEAKWDIPKFEKTLFSENWASGNFTANGWTAAGGFNWIISTSVGNPAPSAMFSYSPQAQNYSQTLTSKTIAGETSARMKLSYDIYLDNFGTTTINQMAVEIWDGASWQTLKNYSNSSGNIVWTSEEIDISPFSGDDFRLRFRAYGGDTYDLNNWNVDNIIVNAAESPQQQAACVLGYNFYLNNVVSGFTTDNKYYIPGNQVQYGTTYDACVLAAYNSGQSDKTCVTFTSRFLWPVKNITGTALENVAVITWEKPTMDTLNTTPPGLDGYRIYRNDSLIAGINSPDSLVYYDVGLEPGSYHYQVTAWYDLTAYGFSGQYDESAPAGPVDLVFNYGRQLPFFEPWDAGTFSFNDWRFSPDHGNWLINTSSGNPAPSAIFTWEPILQAYSYALESPALNGSPLECAKIWLDFDLKLDDRNATGQERFDVEVWYNNAWHPKAEFSNNGSFDWTGYHLDISPAKGKGFRIRFIAKGENSADMISWNIDNVNVYAVCLPPVNLDGETMGYDAYLTWSPPQCRGGGNILNEGFESETFPPANWTQTITNTLATWSHTNTTFPLGVHAGNYAASLMWDYNHQDEWLIVHDVFVNGNLQFWSYAYQGSTHGDHYYIDISSDHGATWTHLFDMSALPAYPGPNGYNTWTTPYIIDMSSYIGEQVDIAWHATDGNGQGLWYAWAIDDCTMGSDKIDLHPTGSPSLNMTKSNNKSLEGYDVYRRDLNTGGYLKINTSVVTDTSYADMNLNEGQYQYYIMPVFNECAQSTASDTIVLDVITGFNEKIDSHYHLYPNPAAELLNVTSDYTITNIDILNFAGESVLTGGPFNAQTATVNVTCLPAGLYLVKVATFRGSHTVKITIMR